MIRRHVDLIATAALLLILALLSQVNKVAFQKSRWMPISSPTKHFRMSMPPGPPVSPIAPSLPVTRD